MDYKLEVNTRFDELEAIFDGNNQGFIADRASIRRDDCEKLVCVFDGKAVGYIVIYHGNGWIEKEKFPLKFKPHADCIYLWATCTKQEWQGKGVATFLLKYTKEKYVDKAIYAAVNQNNQASISILKRANFKQILSFETAKNSPIEGKYFLFEYNSLS